MSTDFSPWQWIPHGSIFRPYPELMADNNDAWPMTRDEIIVRRDEAETMNFEELLDSHLERVDRYYQAEFDRSVITALLCQHKRWHETYNGAECPDCGKVW